MPSTLPSHPVLGEVTARYSVKRSFGRGGRLTIGHRYAVRRPDGTQTEMTASEWDKQVYRLTPRDVHVFQPHIKVGSYVNYYHQSAKISGLWAGTVVKVTRDKFTISPEFVDGIEDALVTVTEVQGETRRELFLFDLEYRNELNAYRTVFHAVEQELTEKNKGSGRHWTEVSNDINNDTRVEEARQKLWARGEELRKLYPTVTNAEAAMIY